MLKLRVLFRCLSESLEVDIRQSCDLSSFWLGFVLKVLLWVSGGLFVTKNRLSRIWSRLRFGYYGEICPKSS